MTDQDLRELERRWRATGLAADGAAWAAAAVRAGQLDPADVALAAHVGHPSVAPADFAVGDVRAWVEGLEPWGHARLVQAALAAGRLVAPRLAEATSMLAAVEAWLACPCADHRNASIAASAKARARERAGGRRRPRRPELAACIDATLTVMHDAARDRAGGAAAHAAEAYGVAPVVRVVQRAVSPLPFAT